MKVLLAYGCLLNFTIFFNLKWDALSLITSAEGTNYFI